MNNPLSLSIERHILVMAILLGHLTNAQISDTTEIQKSTMKIESTLETISIHSFDRQTIYRTSHHIEAPNWSNDGKTILYNSNGLLYKISVEGGEPDLISTGFAKKINNDHGISPDGTQ